MVVIYKCQCHSDRQPYEIKHCCLSKLRLGQMVDILQATFSNACIYIYIYVCVCVNENVSNLIRNFIEACSRGTSNWSWVNMSWGNALVLSGNEPLLQPMSIKIYADCMASLSHNELIHSGQLTFTCINELSHHWFKSGIFTSLASSHYLKHRCHSARNV